MLSRVLVSLPLIVAACSSDLAPYGEVRGFRLLAMRAEPPSLSPGDQTVLSALVTGENAVEYTWSWCPFSGGPREGYACAVDRDTLQRWADETVGANVVLVPEFLLSRTATAALLHAFPPELLRGICLAVREGNVPAFVEPPDCSRAFPITVRLEVRSGAGHIVGVKNLELLYDAMTPPGAQHRNPAIPRVFAASKETPALEVPLAPPGGIRFVRESEYWLRLSLTATEAEERLVVTWFVEGGEMDVTRTAYRAPDQPIESARENLWSTPSRADFPSPRLHLYFVIRDDRGGVSWTRETVDLEP